MNATIADLEKRIDDIKKRMPAHSVRPAMIEELEELQEELDRLKKTSVEEKD
jgi:NADH:ubiquinone oxidoreductase subunit E